MTPIHYLRPLLAPRSVALVGASGRAGSLGRIVYENLLAGGYEGELHLVNPHHRQVLGQPAKRSLAAIGHAVELALIVAPADAVPGIIVEGGKAGLAGAVIVSGAPRADAVLYRMWRNELAKAAKCARVRYLGPESFGVIRTSIGLNATFGPTLARRGRLALISKSGAVCTALLDFAQTAGIGFSSVVALGAGADVDFGEVLEFALADGETDGILLYVETIRDARAFMSALRAAARTKPVIVLKAGRHAAGGGTGPDPAQVFDAALKRAGTVRVQTYTQLFAAARILASGQIARGSRLAIVTNGRGPGLLAADRAAETGVALAEFTPATVSALAATLPPQAERNNPLDVRGTAAPELFGAAVRTVLADENVDAVLALHVPLPAAPPTDTARAVAAAAKGAGKPVLGAWLGAVDRTEAREALEAGGIADFYTPENAIEAFSFLAAYRRNQEWLLEVPPPQPELAAPDLAAAARVREAALAAGRIELTDLEAHALLAAFAIRMAPIAVAETLSAARAAAARIGYPVTLALDAPQGGAPSVRPLLRNGTMLARAHAALLSALPKGSASVESIAVVVRKQVRLPQAQEVRIGVHTDAVFGPVISFGPAGLAAGAREAALMLPPLNRRLAIDLVAGSAAPVSDLDPLIALLLDVSALVCALPWVIELELQPVQASASAAVVAGARVVIDLKRKPGPDRYRHMAIHPYPIELEGTIELRDGSRLRVRPIRPEDAAQERAFVEGLSEQSRYRRFLQHLSGLTPQMLARFTQVDYDRELALVAFDGGDGAETMVGVARYVGNPDQESAEFAITVADARHGRGLGHALMKRLIACAKKRGFKRLVGTVLRVNAPMLRLADALGFTVATDPNDSGQVTVVLELQEGKG